MRSLCGLGDLRGRLLLAVSFLRDLEWGRLRPLGYVALEVSRSFVASRVLLERPGMRSLEVVRPESLFTDPKFDEAKLLRDVTESTLLVRIIEASIFKTALKRPHMNTGPRGHPRATSEDVDYLIFRSIGRPYAASSGWGSMFMFWRSWTAWASAMSFAWLMALRRLLK